jgi:hypothetical protein
MPYAQTVIDNFNDNSYNTAIWSSPSGTTGITETSAALRIAALTGYPEARSIANRNIATGIIGIKVSNTGTTAGAPDMYFGASDSAGNMVLIYNDIALGTWDFIPQGSAAVASKNILITNLWTGWTQGNWFGLGNLGADNVIHFYKSADGITWTEMGNCVVSGTFAKTAVGISLTCGVGTSSTFVGVFDDASYFAFTAPAVPGKIRSGNVWVTPTAVKIRSGNVWVTPTAVKVRSGNVWVTPS